MDFGALCVLGLMVGLSASLAIVGRNSGMDWMHWVFKPIPAILLFAMVIGNANGQVPGFFVAGGLVLSCMGDILLMVPSRPLLPGLLAFLVALVSYAIGFSLDIPWSFVHVAWLCLPALLGFLVLRTLWPQLGRLKPAVVLYVLVMVVFVWRMLVRYDHPDVSNIGYALGVLGGGLFFVSDTTLGFREFVHARIPYTLELGTYFAAQWFLALAFVA